MKLLCNLLVLLTLGTSCLKGEEPLDPCSAAYLRTFFPEHLVNQTLGKFGIQQTQWAGITDDLAIRDKEVISKVMAKASSMNPNPLSNPVDKPLAVQLFQEILWDEFSTVMKAHGLVDEAKNREMFQEIRKLKAEGFATCSKIEVK